MDGCRRVERACRSGQTCSRRVRDRTGKGADVVRVLEALCGSNRATVRPGLQTSQPPYGSSARRADQTGWQGQTSPHIRHRQSGEGSCGRASTRGWPSGHSACAAMETMATGRAKIVAVARCTTCRTGQFASLSRVPREPVRESATPATPRDESADGRSATAARVAGLPTAQRAKFFKL